MVRKGVKDDDGRLISTCSIHLRRRAMRSGLRRACLSTYLQTREAAETVSTCLPRIVELSYGALIATIAATTPCGPLTDHGSTSSALRPSHSVRT